MAEPDSYARRLSAASTVYGGGAGGAGSLDTRTGSMDTQRRASDAEEVEAGLALAGLGIINNKRRESDNSPPNGSAASSSSAQPSSAKKAKKEEKQGSTGGGSGKDTRKSCQECRRLKAKCDRVFPCSNCEWWLVVVNASSARRNQGRSWPPRLCPIATRVSRPLSDRLAELRFQVAAEVARSFVQTETSLACRGNVLYSRQQNNYMTG